MTADLPQSSVDKLRAKIDQMLTDSGCPKLAQRELSPAIMQAVTAEIGAAQARIDQNTWNWINGFRGNCVCEACVEISKQMKRVSELRNHFGIGEDES